MHEQDVPRPRRCELFNPAFALLGPATFRRAEADLTPVMVVALGEREAALPLRGLQRELHIEDASPDGRMLGLIAESLDYVSELRLGDELPAEVLDGGASWAPSAHHRAVAEARLRGQLLAWLDPQGGASLGELTAERLQRDAHLRTRTLAAFEQAAAALGLREPQEVVSLVAIVAEELGYIEALREQLLVPVARLARLVERLGEGWRGDDERATTLVQVRRLSRNALGQIAQSFAEVDTQTSEIMTTLGNVEGQRSFIRSHRDWLYRARRAWAPTLQSWEGAEPYLTDAAWQRLAATYHFLAPRYMRAQEWTSPGLVRRARRQQPSGPVMRW
jgi:hypothetical protein